MTLSVLADPATLTRTGNDRTEDDRIGSPGPGGWFPLAASIAKRVAIVGLVLLLGACNGGRKERETAKTEGGQKSAPPQQSASRASGESQDDQRPLDSYMLGNYRMGGDFTLIDQEGKKWTLSGLKGRVVLMAFGYTSCPDICPITVSTMARALKGLKDKAPKSRMVFVTVDPERDTPRKIKAYLSYFNPQIIGLTGALDAVEGVARQYQAVFRKQQKGSAAGYLVGHTSFYYLLDHTGKVRYMFPHDAPLPILLEGLEKLIAAGAKKAP